MTIHISLILTLSLLNLMSALGKFSQRILDDFVSLDLAPSYDEGHLENNLSEGLVVMMSISSVTNNPLAFSLLPPTFYTSSWVRLLSFFKREISLSTLMASYSVSV